jgi:hypothetical protein
MNAQDLVGVYVGRGRGYVAKDGTSRRSGEGDHPARIVYTKEGLVFAISTPANRAKTGAKDPGEATPEQKARMVEGVVAYAGRYELVDGRLRHHIEVSVFPDLVGRTMVRIPSFEGNRLTLTTEPDQDGGVQKIYWERVGQP